MKKTKSIALDRMRKGKKTFVYAPLAIMTTLALTSCDGSSEPSAKSMIQECTEDQPSCYAEQYQAVYDYVLKQAQEKGPKFTTREACEEKYGSGNCQKIPTTTAAEKVLYMPVIAGVTFVSEKENNDEKSNYRLVPVYTSMISGSQYYSNMHPYRRDYIRTPIYSRDRHDRYSSNTYNSNTYDSNGDKSGKYKSDKKPTKTASRGGFGSSVSAKSSWGSSRSSSRSWGWGG